MIGGIQLMCFEGTMEPLAKQFRDFEPCTIVNEKKLTISILARDPRTAEPGRRPGGSPGRSGGAAHRPASLLASAGAATVPAETDRTAAPPPRFERPARPQCDSRTLETAGDPAGPTSL